MYIAIVPSWSLCVSLVPTEDKKSWSDQPDLDGRVNHHLDAEIQTQASARTSARNAEPSLQPHIDV